jgi:hypothetical protein
MTWCRFQELLWQWFPNSVSLWLTGWCSRNTLYMIQILAWNPYVSVSECMHCWMRWEDILEWSADTEMEGCGHNLCDSTILELTWGDWVKNIKSSVRIAGNSAERWLRKHETLLALSHIFSWHVLQFRDNFIFTFTVWDNR